MTCQPQYTRCSLALHKKVLQLSVYYSARSRLYKASPPRLLVNEEFKTRENERSSHWKSDRMESGMDHFIRTSLFNTHSVI